LIQLCKVGLLAEGTRNGGDDTKCEEEYASHDNNEWGWNIQQNYP
jgi:hypothetical protein